MNIGWEGEARTGTLLSATQPTPHLTSRIENTWHCVLEISSITQYGNGYWLCKTNTTLDTTYRKHLTLFIGNTWYQASKILDSAYRRWLTPCIRNYTTFQKYQTQHIWTTKHCYQYHKHHTTWHHISEALDTRHQIYWTPHFYWTPHNGTQWYHNHHHSWRHVLETPEILDTVDRSHSIWDTRYPSTQQHIFWMLEITKTTRHLDWNTTYPGWLVVLHSSSQQLCFGKLIKKTIDDWKLPFSWRRYLFHFHFSFW